MKDRKKGVVIIGILLMLVFLLTGVVALLFIKGRELGQPGSAVVTEMADSKEADNEEPEPASEENTQWSADSLRKGLTTVIEYDKQYNAKVSSKEEAREAIIEYGIRQRERYSNSAVTDIELQIEQDYDLFAVNLGEIDEETAQDIEKAFFYMYETYPEIRGTLTNLSLGNFENPKAGNIAVTQNSEFIINEEFGRYPFVVKYEIILNAAKFTNREKLLKDCAYNIETGYWPEGSDITSIVVHELGHQLLNVIAMQQFGFQDCYYVTEENADGYSQYVTDSLSVNQTVGKSIMQEAYTIWTEEYGNTGSEEDFRSSISHYAKGEQADGGVSYGETFAEAVADIYLNGEQAADASKAILQVAADRLQ